MKIYLDTTNGRGATSKRIKDKHPNSVIELNDDTLFDEDELDKMIRFRNENMDKEFILLTNDRYSKICSWLEAHFNFTKIVSIFGGQQ